MGRRRKPRGRNSALLRLQRRPLGPDGDRRRDGFTFTKGITSIGSSAGIFVTAAQAATAYKRLVKPGLPRCVAEVSLRDLPTGHIRIRSARPTPFVPLGQRSDPLRLVIEVSGNGRIVDVFVDRVLVRTARAIATISLTEALRPVTASLEHALAMKVANRMPRT